MEAKSKTRFMAETKAKPLAEPGVVPPNNSEVMPTSRFSAVHKYEVKADAGSDANIRSLSRADNKADIGSRPLRKKEASTKFRDGDNRAGIIESNDEDEENVCSWFWTGEEPSLGSWFWPEEKNPFQAYIPPPPKIEEEPETNFDSTIKRKAAAWSRARYSVLVPIDGGKSSLPPEGNWTLVSTLIETPLGIRPLTKIPPFDDGPYFQTLADLKEQIKYKEKYGPNPKKCRCRSPVFSLEQKEFDKLVALLTLTRDPFIHRVARMIMGISPAYPFTQDIVHDVGITVMIENLVNNPNVKEHPRALNKVNDNSESSEEAKTEQLYVNEVCKDIISCPLNSSAQHAELKLLEHLSMKFQNHHIIANYIPDLLILLDNGNGKTKFYVLRVFARLSKNQANTRELISAKVLSSLVAPFNKNESKTIVLNIIEIFENINFQFKKRVKLFTKEEFTKFELISIFQEAKQFSQKLQDITEHSDPEVRDKVIRLILKL